MAQTEKKRQKPGKEGTICEGQRTNLREAYGTDIRFTMST